MTGGSGGIGVRFTQLEAAIDEFVARPESLYTAAEIGDQIVHLVRCADRIRLEAARLVGVFVATHEAEAQGANDPVDWIRERAHTSVGEALALRAVGTHVDALPLSVEALEKGEIGFGHVLQVARNAAFSDGSRTAAFDESVLVEHARCESVGRFRRTCLSLRHVQDPDGVVAAEAAAVEFRSLTFNETEDGRFYMNVELDPVGYAAAITAIDARSDRVGSDDHRIKSRRRADGSICAWTTWPAPPSPRRACPRCTSL